jgi:hypothetical protein
MTINTNMNRKERRAARKLGAVVISHGRLQCDDPNDGLPVECYVCGAAHKAHGLVRIEDGRSIKIAALCDACLAGEKDQQIMRKFLNAPDFEISDEVTIEQLTALADKQAMTEH